MRRVIVVGWLLLRVGVALLHHDVAGELALLGVGLELEIVGVELQGVLELPEALVEEGGGDVLVVYAEG